MTRSRPTTRADSWSRAPSRRAPGSSRIEGPLLCAHCGYTGDPLAFDGERLGRGRSVCMRCRLARARRRRRRNRFAYPATTAGLAVTSAVLLAARPGSESGWLLATCALIAVVAPAFVILHELGHAAAGRLAGLEVFQISVGEGKRVWRGPIAGVLVTLREIPLSGLVFASSESARFVRLRRIALLLGGPGANLAFALALLPLTPIGSVSPMPNFARALVAALFWTNFGMGVLNLVPMSVETAFGSHRTDGLQLVDALFARSAKLRQWREGHYVLAWTTAYDLGDAAHMRSVSQAAAVLFPDSAQVAMLQAASSYFAGDVGTACDSTCTLLERTDLAPLMRAFAKCNLAFYQFLVGDTSNLEEADRLSAEVIAELPWHPSAQAVRGAVLIWRDQAELALAPLEEAAKSDAEEDSGWADVDLLLSMAYVQLARAEDARRHYAKAQTLRATSQLRERARLAVESAL